MSDPVERVIEKLVSNLPLVTRTMFAAIRQTAHPAHYYALAVLENGSCPVSDLADYLGVSLPSMSNLLDTLESRGWVRRVSAPHDGRVVLVEIARAGRAALREMREAASASLRGPLTGLDPEEISALLAGLAVIERAFACSPARGRRHAENIVKSNA